MQRIEFIDKMDVRYVAEILLPVSNFAGQYSRLVCFG